MAAESSADRRSRTAAPRPAAGQSILETMLLLAVVVTALVVLFTFIRDAVASRIKLGSDTFGHGMLHNGN